MKEGSSSASEHGGQGARIGGAPVGRRLRSPRRSIEFLRAFARALRDPATYDLRSNAGLWLGFMLAVPIPVLALLSSAPPWIVDVALVAPLAWSVIVGAAAQVGIVGSSRLQQMRLDTSDRQRIHEEACLDLQDAVDDQRSENERLERLQRRAQAELVLGQVIQASLVPDDIIRDDLEVALRHIPCTHVGGDYLQASLPRPDLLYLCVGDVAGHGVAAALVVSRIHALVQGMIQSEVPPGPFLESLNSAVLALFKHTSFFMTFAVLRVDLSTRTIDYATAGHPSQFLLRSGRKVEELSTPNSALGLQATVLNPEGSVGSTTYEPGDTLLLFTDGIFEARAPGAREIWGEGSLRSEFVRHGRHAPEVLVATILDEAAGFRGVRGFEDDVSLLAARLGVASPSLLDPQSSPERVKVLQ